MEKQPVMKLEKIEKVYGTGDARVAALSSIDMEIHEGERVSIVGPSGCGKSTLLSILGLLDSPTTGRMYFDGHDVTRLTEDQTSTLRGRRIGFVFQAFHLVPSIDAHSNVALPLLFQGIGKDERLRRSKAVLERLGMGDRLHHYPSQLSGGQRQRVAIARALVTNPAIILADEPTGNLDSKAGADVLHILDELHKDGGTVVVVTHDPNVAKLSERIIRMKDGAVEREEGKKKSHAK
jgi:putative ABC transport system ATP-binding protein